MFLVELDLEDIEKLCQRKEEFRLTKPVRFDTLKRFAQKRRKPLKDAENGERNKFEDNLSVKVEASIQTACSGRYRKDL
jgi:hypothetical protein